ncbi:hypothetical protein AALP_AA8G248400 [Arabis alpina]|uniref:Uncharacterized protein n=1 Tax=Arabis alpina TaxID=50452 RepID=A0A087G985_ARAAL|nr:hypothetical protein AALP_AA8G248400 [Arabis alpina]
MLLIHKLPPRLYAIASLPRILADICTLTTTTFLVVPALNSHVFCVAQNIIPLYSNAGVPHSGFVNQASSLNHRDFVTGRPGTSCFDLPPSLKPPPQHGFPQLPSIDWG